MALANLVTRPYSKLSHVFNSIASILSYGYENAISNGKFFFMPLGYLKSAAKRNKSPQMATTKATITPQHYWPAHEDYDFEAEVIGESNYQNHLKTLAGDHGQDAAAVDALAVLMPEPTNPYDKNAVCIYIGDKAVGYLPKDDARAFLRRLTKRKLSRTAATTCEARIMGGHIMQDGSKASYGVLLNIEPLYED